MSVHPLLDTEADVLLLPDPQIVARPLANEQRLLSPSSTTLIAKSSASSGFESIARW